LGIEQFLFLSIALSCSVGRVLISGSCSSCFFGATVNLNINSAIIDAEIKAIARGFSQSDSRRFFLCILERKRRSDRVENRYIVQICGAYKRLIIGLDITSAYRTTFFGGRLNLVQESMNLVLR
jgi:hypothetical protein